MTDAHACILVLSQVACVILVQRSSEMTASEKLIFYGREMQNFMQSILFLNYENVL